MDSKTVIDHRACLVRSPYDQVDLPQWLNGQQLVTALRLQTQTFGREVIDIEFIRGLFLLAADALSAHLSDVTIPGDYCTSCGMAAPHTPTCDKVKAAHLNA